MKMKGLTLLSLVLAVATAAPSVQAGGEDYYRQFMYAVEEHDDGTGEILVQYRMLMSFMNEVAITPDRLLMIDINLFLLPNDEFAMTYTESYKVRASANAPWGFEPTELSFCPKVIRGTWSAPGQALETSLGFHADRATFDGRPSVKIVLDRPIRSSEAVGREFVMDYGYSNAPIDVVLNHPGCNWPPH